MRETAEGGPADGYCGPAVALDRRSGQLNNQGLWCAGADAVLKETEMFNGIFRVPQPKNEQPLDYAPGSPERAALKAKLKQIDERFRRYPERALEDHRFRGYLGEQIFHMVLNDLDILHSYRDPLLQDAEIRKRRKAKADFRVGEDLVEVKTSCSRKKPKKLWVRKSRWLRHKADILVFIWIDREFKEGRILGWLPGSEIASFKTVEKRDGVCYEIPRARLKPFYKLLERWKYEPEQFIVERQ